MAIAIRRLNHRLSLCASSSSDLTLEIIRIVLERRHWIVGRTVLVSLVFVGTIWKRFRIVSIPTVDSRSDKRGL